MAKVSLAVKYRPQSFDDLTEQKAIKTILTNQIEDKSFQHAYLFTGPAGTGKTTSARIFANMINDNKGNPIEVDAASNSGVDNIRQIIEDSKRKPLDCEFKIFIIDECHSLSNGAWQALLKLLEEPPAFSIFILCTTDPQKIPETILSRVQRFQFNKISNDGVVKRLAQILNWEGCPQYDENNVKNALEHIAKLANGGMRAAISMLDKCLSYDSQLSVENVLKVAGSSDLTVYFELFYGLVNKSKAAVGIIEQQFAEGKDLKLFISEFNKFCADVWKYILTDSFKYCSLIPNTEENTKTLEGFKETQQTKAFNEIWDLLIEINNEIKWDADAKTVIELHFISFVEN